MFYKPSTYCLSAFSSPQPPLPRRQQWLSPALPTAVVPVCSPHNLSPRTRFRLCGVARPENRDQSTETKVHAPKNNQKARIKEHNSKARTSPHAKEVDKSSRPSQAFPISCRTPLFRDGMLPYAYTYHRNTVPLHWAVEQMSCPGANPVWLDRYSYRPFKRWRLWERGLAMRLSVRGEETKVEASRAPRG